MKKNILLTNIIPSESFHLFTLPPDIFVGNHLWVITDKLSPVENYQRTFSTD